MYIATEGDVGSSGPGDSFTSWHVVGSVNGTMGGNGAAAYFDVPGLHTDAQLLASSALT
jgi:hypothetical protein